MESEFQRMQRLATEQLRQMNARAIPSPPAPPVLPNPPDTAGNKKKEQSSPFDIISSLFSGSSDSLLLAGILFLLYREKGDNILMLALLYILM